MGALVDVLTRRRRPPAGPAGYLKGRADRTAAAHDRPPSPLYDFGDPRHHAYTVGPSDYVTRNIHPVYKRPVRRNTLS